MNKIIKKIAKNHGVSVTEVEKELKTAILEGMKNRNANSFSQNFWNELSPNGEVPSPEQFIRACAARLPKTAG